jgi:hypothetical protein
MGGKRRRRVQENQYDRTINPVKLSKYGPLVLENFTLELAACVRSALQLYRGSGDKFGKVKEAKTSCPCE